MYLNSTATEQKELLDPTIQQIMVIGSTPDNMIIPRDVIDDMEQILDNGARCTHKIMNFPDIH